MSISSRWRSLDGYTVPMPIWDEITKVHAAHVARAAGRRYPPLSEWEFVLTLLVQGVRVYQAGLAKEAAQERLIKTPTEVAAERRR